MITRQQNSAKVLQHTYMSFDEQMASENCQLTAKPRQLLRAKCIPDADWETHRERLIELYLESDISRKDIVDVMAQRHNFVMTY